MGFYYVTSFGRIEKHQNGNPPPMHLQLLVWCLNVFLTPFLLAFHSTRIYFVGCIFAYLRRACCAVLCVVCSCSCWLFNDKSFPRDDSSLGNYEGKDKSSPAVWVRGDKIFGCGPDREDHGKLFTGKVEPSDICQGQLGDCWLLSAIACLSESPGAVESCFVTREYNPRGSYKVTLWDARRGAWETVKVDDWFPCRGSKRASSKWEPLFATPNQNELWVLILEKAFAKFVGSYAELEGGHALWALQALTGDKVLKINRTPDGKAWEALELGPDPKASSRRDVRFLVTGEEYDDDQVFELLRRFDAHNYLLAASSRGVDATRVQGREGAGTQGIVPGHAYTILQARRVEGYRLVRLRNPWGAFEWTGAWSDTSPMWKNNPKVATSIFEELRGISAKITALAAAAGVESAVEASHRSATAAAEANVADDGAFWMEWSDFLKYFRSVDVCMKTHDMDDLVLDLREDDGCTGPAKGCLKGCGGFWCRCRGCMKLWCGGKKGHTVAVEGV